MSALYTFENVVKTYEEGGKTLEILKGVTTSIDEGEQLAIVGASGSGKSTLLHLMGAIDTPTSGSVSFQGRDLATLTPEEQAHFRNRTCGYVFQFHHLLAEFSAEENVAMPGIIAGLPRQEVETAARDMLDRVGLGSLLRPKVLLADEPTGNLDEKTGNQVATLLRDLNREFGMTMVIVTHNGELARSLDRSLELRSGLLL